MALSNINRRRSPWSCEGLIPQCRRMPAQWGGSRWVGGRGSSPRSRDRPGKTQQTRIFCGKTLLLLFVCLFVCLFETRSCCVALAGLLQCSPDWLPALGSTHTLNSNMQAFNKISDMFYMEVLLYSPGWLHISEACWHLPLEFCNQRCALQ